VLHVNPSTVPVTEIEQECIRIALEMRLDSLQLQLKGPSIWQPENSWSLDGLSLQMDVPPGIRGKVKQVLILPVAIPLLAAALLLMFYLYLAETWERAKKRRRLLQELRAIKRSRGDLYEVPEEKTLWELWRWYGLDKGSSEAEQLRLLSLWVEMLYGRALRQQFDFKAMLFEIRNRNFEANTPYYNGDRTAPFFFFNDNASSLAIALSGKLPPYGG
jgi:hypothetical protein